MDLQDLLEVVLCNEREPLMREFSNMRRQNDWVRILTLIALTGTVTGLAWALVGYPVQWSNNTRRLNKLEPEILVEESRVTALEANQLRMEGNYNVILSKLEDMKEDMQYLKRHSDK